MIFNEQYEPFQKDFRKLEKKFSSLSQDFLRFKKALETDGIRLSGVERLQKCPEALPFYKARKFRCQSMPNKGSMSGIRVIFCLDQSTEPTITFIEIYSKNQQENNDHQRILNFCAERGIN